MLHKFQYNFVSSKRIDLISLAIISIATLTKSELCSDGWAWSKYSGTCITYNATMRKNWTEAREECKKLQADLVVILNEEHNNFLHDMVQSVQATFLIGLNALKVNREFKWLDSDEKPSYTKWWKNQPDSIHSLDNCGYMNHMYGKSTRTWTKHGCQYETSFFCEKFQDTTGKCSEGWAWSPKSGTCMKVFVKEISWRSAIESCRNYGSDLLTILNKATNDFLQEFLSPQDDFFWIGLSNVDDHDTFRWMDYADEVAYTKWASNPNLEGTKCVQVKKPQEGWDIADCRQKKKFICEIYSDNCFQHAEAICPVNCSSSCQDNACNRRSGVCSLGCIDGFKEPRCDEMCSGNTFGMGCNFTCNPNCGGPDKACNFSTGYCLHGCFGDFSGPFCSNYTLYRTWDKEHSSNNLAAGIILALLLAALFLLFFAMEKAANSQLWQEGEQRKSTQPETEDGGNVEEIVDFFLDERQKTSRHLYETFDEHRENFENELNQSMSSVTQGKF